MTGTCDIAVLQAELAALRAQNEELRAACGELAESVNGYRKLERTLRESEERYRMLFEHSPDATFLSFGDGEIFAANPAACSMLGMTEEEIRAAGRDGIVVAPASEIASIVARRREQGQVTAEIAVRAKDGTVIPVEVTSALFSDGTGRAIVVARDIKDKLDLRKSQGRLAKAQSIARMGDWEWNIGTGELQWSPEMYSIFGVAPGFAPSIAAFEGCVHPEDLASVRWALQQSATGGVAPKLDFRIVTSAGSTRVMTSVGEVICGEDGKPSLVVGINQDVTERKVTEAAFRESRKLYKLLADTSPDLIAMTDLSGRPTFMNRRWIEYAGVSVAELDQREWQSLVHPDDLAALAESPGAAARAGGSFETEIRYRRHDGQYRWFWRRMVAVRDDSGELTGWVCVCTDMTERKESQEALWQSEERFRKIFEEGPLGAVILDLEYRFLKTNRRFCEMCGYSADELLGITPAVLTHPDDIPLTLLHPKQLLEGKVGHFSVDKRYLHKNGTVIWVTVTAWLMKNAGGRPSYIIATVQDITDQKKLQNQLILAAKRQERARSSIKILNYEERLGQLASKLSIAQEEERRRIAVQVHDGIGQNLAFCKLKVGQLQKVAKEIAPGLQDVMDTIERCIGSSRSLSFELSPAVLFDIGLEPALQWLARLHSARHGVRITVTGQSTSPLPLPARILLFQAAREFLANAVKHAGASQIEISLSESKRSVIVTVSDDGAGFVVPAAGVLPDFTTGFGLFNVQEQLRNAGGSLQLRSQPGCGTRAQAALPLKRRGR